MKSVCAGHSEILIEIQVLVSKLCRKKRIPSHRCLGAQLHDVQIT